VVGYTSASVVREWETLMWESSELLVSSSASLFPHLSSSQLVNSFDPSTTSQSV
jgi:hypothetical protein